jgi:hypothetical protein
MCSSNTLNATDKHRKTMAWTKGVSGNPKGRPKDAVATAVRESIGESLDLEKLRYSLELLPEGSEYVQGVAKLLPYVLPRLNAVEVLQVGDLTQNLQALDDAELGKLIKAVLEEYESRPISKASASEPEDKYTIHEGLY